MTASTPGCRRAALVASSASRRTDGGSTCADAPGAATSAAATRLRASTPPVMPGALDTTSSGASSQARTGSGTTSARRHSKVRRSRRLSTTRWTNRCQDLRDEYREIGKGISTERLEAPDVAIDVGVRPIRGDLSALRAHQASPAAGSPRSLALDDRVRQQCRPADDVPHLSGRCAGLMGPSRLWPRNNGREWAPRPLKMISPASRPIRGCRECPVPRDRPLPC